MKLSLIILNYKNKNLVKYFLKTVVDFHFNFDWEIIVVDNHSSDGVEKILASEFEEPWIHFIENKKNLGMGAGNNTGIRGSSGEYILIVNPDVTLNQASVEKLVDFLDQHQKAAIVAPAINNPDGTRQDTTFRFPRFSTFLYRRSFLGNLKSGQRHLNFYLYKNADSNASRMVDWVLGGCFIVRRSALDAVGLFDEKFFLFLEDTDLCRRLRQSGWEIWYYPTATAIHLPHRLSAGEGSIKDIFSKLTWIHLMSWLRYFWKWRKSNL